jgi:hypothetical protein
VASLEQTTYELCATLRAFCKELRTPNPYGYVLEHGELFDAAPLPKPFPYRRFRAPKSCFRNAGLLALEHDEPTYVQVAAAMRWSGLWGSVVEHLVSTS